MNNPDGRPLIPRSRQRLGGAFIMLVGAGATYWTWHHAATAGEVYTYAAMAFPAFAVTGLGIILFPGYAEERAARGEDISELSGAQLITPRWWVILVIALLAGATNHVLLTRG